MSNKLAFDQRLDDFVTLTREQQAAFDQRLDDFLACHRSEELPRYREFIVTSLDTLEDGVTLEEAVAISEEIDLAADRFQAQFIELLLATAEDLSDEQIQDFLTELERNQTEYADERLVRDEEAYYADSTKTMTDLVKRLIGRLNRDQRSEIAERSKDLTRLDGLWHDDRARWGGALRVILEAKAPGLANRNSQAWRNTIGGQDSRVRCGNRAQWGRYPRAPSRYHQFAHRTARPPDATVFGRPC